MFVIMAYLKLNHVCKLFEQYFSLKIIRKVMQIENLVFNNN